MKEEIVSVIMPVYNSGKYLQNSVNSILKQTYTSLELIIVDDCSTDQVTIDLLKILADTDKRIKVIFQNENHGASHARNTAINLAQGRYIAFCDSDDRWTPNKLEEQIKLMRQKDCALSCTSYYITDGNGILIGLNNPPQHITYAMMKRDDKIGCSTAIYDTKLLGRKHYMPQLHQCEDWGLFLNILKDCNDCYAYTQEPLAYYCKRRDSLSSSKLAQAKYNILVHKKILGYSSVKAILYFLLCFMPTYLIKIYQRKMDSYKFRHCK